MPTGRSPNGELILNAGLRSQLRQLIAVGPHRGEHTVAIRAALSVAVPLLVLLGIGHIEWSLYATFGAFTALYGRTSPLRPRLRMQAFAGLTLTVSVLLGVLIGISPYRSWLLIPVAAVWATFIALIAHRRHWHPPGPLFPVFALGACASVPATWTDVPIALTVVVSSALFAIGLTALVSLLGRSGLIRKLIKAGPRPTPARPKPAGSQQRLIEWRLRHYPIRYAISVAIAGLIATSIGFIGHPYWAMVAAVVPMAAPDQGARLLRAAQRLIGTVIGVVIAGAILALDLPSLLVILIAALLQAGAELTVGRNYGLALLFITPLALSMTQLAHPLPIGELVRDRTVETFIGVAVAVIITLLTRERRQDAEG
ncbi:FUSC family protein [Microlunatus elymi]|uniref:FUSC family protein n=1 Tax=Microlunatus elymi TaxID=2596828 RepID=A0A516Q143_9ACTN|nr:FUSC family protein [Microlunatus elymi]QDP97136.1 FUSC family protein [Microlunatus elymi]